MKQKKPPREKKTFCVYKKTLKMFMLKAQLNGEKYRDAMDKAMMAYVNMVGGKNNAD